MALLMRPGSTLLLAGIVSFVASRFIGSLPILGSMLATMLFLFSLFAILGGIWLTVAGRLAART